MDRGKGEGKVTGEGIGVVGDRCGRRGGGVRRE